MQRDRRIRVNRATIKNRAKGRTERQNEEQNPSASWRICQAIDLDGTANSCSSGERRLCEALSNWRTRTAGTGRLNR
jgi:hypothetical protein